MVKKLSHKSINTIKGHMPIALSIGTTHLLKTHAAGYHLNLYQDLFKIIRVPTEMCIIKKVRSGGFREHLDPNLTTI